MKTALIFINEKMRYRVTYAPPCRARYQQWKVLCLSCHSFSGRQVEHFGDISLPEQW
jgi:hypothetical protein